MDPQVGNHSAVQKQWRNCTRDFFTKYDEGHAQHTHRHAHTHTQRTHTHVRTKHTHVHTQTCAQTAHVMYSPSMMRTKLSKHVCVCVCVCVCMCVCVCVCVCMCVCVCVCVCVCPVGLCCPCFICANQRVPSVCVSVCTCVCVCVCVRVYGENMNGRRALRWIIVRSSHTLVCATGASHPPTGHASTLTRVLVFCCAAHGEHSRTVLIQHNIPLRGRSVQMDQFPFSLYWANRRFVGSFWRRKQIVSGQRLVLCEEEAGWPGLAWISHGEQRGGGGGRWGGSH